MGLPDQLLEGLPADAAIERLEGPRDLPALADALRARGWPEPTIAALFGDNLLRLLRRALAA